MKSLPSSILLLLLAVPLLFTSCSKPDYPPYIYETIGMSLSSADNSGETPVSDNDSVPLPAFAIQMDLNMIMTDDTKADSYESYYQNEDEVTEFRITSPSVFNGVPANQSLNHFFNYSTGAGTGALISGPPYTYLFSGTDQVNGVVDEWSVTKYLMLMNPPSTTGNYTFIVHAGFNDGRILADTITVNLY